MAQFGLKRGIEGSSAKHEDIRRYYADLNKAIYDIPDPYENETAHEYKKRAIEELGTARAANLKEINTTRRKNQQSMDQYHQEFRIQLSSERKVFRDEIENERQEFKDEIELERKVVNMEIEGKKEAAKKELKSSKEKLDALSEDIGFARDDLIRLQEQVEEYEEKRKKINVERLKRLEEAERFKKDFDYGMEIMADRYPDVAENMKDYLQLMMDCVEEEKAMDEAYEEGLLSEELYNELYGDGSELDDI